MRKNPAQEMARALTLIPLSDTTTPSAESSCHPLHSSAPHAFLSVSLAPLSLSDDWWAAAAALSQALRLRLVSPPATSTHQVLPTFPLPFTLCEAEHQNPNLKLFSYLIDKPPSFKVFEKLLGAFTVSAPGSVVIFELLLLLA